MSNCSFIPHWIGLVIRKACINFSFWELLFLRCLDHLFFHEMFSCLGFYNVALLSPGSFFYRNTIFPFPFLVDLPNLKEGLSQGPVLHYLPCLPLCLELTDSRDPDFGDLMWCHANYHFFSNILRNLHFCPRTCSWAQIYTSNCLLHMSTWLFSIPFKFSRAKSTHHLVLFSTNPISS